MSGTKALKAQSAYSRPEGPTNFITYVLAAGLSFVGLVFLLIKAGGIDAAAIASSVVCGTAVLFVFTVGALVHILAPGPVRNVLYNIDRTAVCLLVAGVFAPVFICGLAKGGTIADMVWGYTLFGVVTVCAVTACAVTAADVKQYKLVCLILYVTIGLCCGMRMMRIVEVLGSDWYWWLLGGGAAYIVGAVFFSYGKRPFWHTVWHMFVICGAALHFVSVYLYTV